MLESHRFLCHDVVHDYCCFEWSYSLDQTVHVTVLDLNVDGTTIFKSSGDLDWDCKTHVVILLDELVALKLVP